MKAVNRKILEQALGAAAEALTIVRLDQTDWPVVFANPAFDTLRGAATTGAPFADVVESMLGRELAIEVSETLRHRQETSYPVELGGREYLAVFTPLTLPNETDARFYAVFWRRGGHGGADLDAQHALLKAKRRIRDLSRDDPVTGLFNARAFREMLEHDWAVAKREKGRLALVVFSLDDFAAYVDVFGRHAADSSLRRVGQAIRRCLRRASDVVARLDDDRFVVLSHASEEAGVREFAGRISAAVRELGLHHPRSTHGRFVTVSYEVGAIEVADAKSGPEDFLASFSD